MSNRLFFLDYHYPQHVGPTAYPGAAQAICRAVSQGLAFHRVSSVVLILSVVGLLSFFISLRAGVVAFGVFCCAAAFKVGVLGLLGVRLRYTMDQNWRNYANTRMAPFTYMSKSSRLWEVTGSSGGHDRKYNAGCSIQLQRKAVRVAYSVPFPFKPNVKAYTLYLPGAKFVFLPDCVCMIQGAQCTALHYEHIKWSIGMTRFVESSAPNDSRVVGQTWQYVNKQGGPDRRFAYNPALVECAYGEFSVNFANYRRTKLLLSGTRVAECIIGLPSST